MPAPSPGDLPPFLDDSVIEYFKRCLLQCCFRSLLGIPSDFADLPSNFLCPCSNPYLFRSICGGSSGTGFSATRFFFFGSLVDSLLLVPMLLFLTYPHTGLTFIKGIAAVECGVICLGEQSLVDLPPFRPIRRESRIVYGVSLYSRSKAFLAIGRRSGGKYKMQHRSETPPCILHGLLNVVFDFPRPNRE